MDGHTDIHLTQGETSQTLMSIPEDGTADHTPASSAIASGEDSAPGNSSASNVHLDLDLVTDGCHIEGQGSVQLDQEHMDVQPAADGIEHEPGWIDLQSDFKQVAVPAISKELPPSEVLMVHAGESAPLTIIDDPKIFCPEEPPLWYQTTVSSAVPRDEREGDSRPHDPLNRTQMLHTDLDGLQGDRPTDEETRDDFGYHCKNFPSSLPPSSSPPQIFSSSPCASSQSSVGGVKLSKSVGETGSSPNSDSSHTEYLALIAQNESGSEPKHPSGRVAVEAAGSPEPSNLSYYSDADPSGCSPSPSEKRVAHESEVDGSQPVKRPKLDSSYLPPTPIRVTLASQNRQFKKLATPFRPPSNLLVSRDEQSPTADGRPVASATSSSGPEIDDDRPDSIKRPTRRVSPPQRKASNTSRSVAQFKSPLVSGILSADSRAVRLTPALQALERKLQLLKRAIKVKEDKEEEALGRLTEKWITAGREVAYDVWDAARDSGDSEGKAMLAHRTYGWEGVNNGNYSWGWDSKAEDGRGESHGSTTPRLPSDEDGDVSFNYTLGTMLRQLGIAPETFGWDDEKETFSD